MNPISELGGALAHHIRVDPPYGYVPTKSITILFIVLFSISTLLHLGQAIRFRLWWLLPTACLCGLLEIIGWAARFWSSVSPLLETPFEMQITATILAPTPFVAANFIILGKIIHRLGPAYSRLSPKWYAILFCTFDVISLVVQAVGGGSASVAVSKQRDPTPGGHIMLGGIAFQMVTITIYVICAIEFFVRYAKNTPIRKVEPVGEKAQLPTRTPMDKKMLFMSGALMFSTTCLFIRAVYRTIELSNGWTGRIIHTQVFFNVLDGGMITLAMFTLNFAHPGHLLTEPAEVVEKDERISTPSSE